MNELKPGQKTVLLLGRSNEVDRRVVERARNYQQAWVTSTDDLQRVLIKLKADVLILDAPNLDSEALVRAGRPKWAVLLSPLLETPLWPTIHIHRGSVLPAAWRRQAGSLYGLGLKYAIVPQFVLAHRAVGRSREPSPSVDTDRRVNLGLAAGARPSSFALATFGSIWREIRASGRRPQALVSGLRENDLLDELGRTGVALEDVLLAPKADPWELLKYAHIVVASGGQSLIEAAALAVPTVAIPSLPGQLEVAQSLSGRGASQVISESSTNRDQLIREMLPWIYREVNQGFDRRCESPWLDGQGARRAADLIVSNAQRGTARIHTR